jgi:hypothetical protein
MTAMAEEVLRANIRCTNAQRRDIRRLAKSLLDETDELTRTLHEIQTNASRVQLNTESPKEVVDIARRLKSINLPNSDLEEKIRTIADLYVQMAEKHDRDFEEFKRKNADFLPPQ